MTPSDVLQNDSIKYKQKQKHGVSLSLVCNLGTTRSIILMYFFFSYEDVIYNTRRKLMLGKVNAKNNFDKNKKSNCLDLD